MSSNRRPTVAQVELIALATSDVERLRDFYERLGAVPSALSTDPATGLRSCVLDFSGVQLELFERRAGDGTVAGVVPSSALAHIGLALGSADAVDEVSRAIAAAGHQVIEPPHRSSELGRYESVVLDPDGNRLKLTV